MAYIPLFCQSHHSPFGVASPSDLVRRARAMGHNTIGLCDDSTIAGYHEFDESCRKESLRPVFGCRLTCRGFTLTGRKFPLSLFIESEQGYRNLVRLLNRQVAVDSPRVEPLGEIDLRDHLNGLFCVVPPDGELAALLELKDRRQTEKFLANLARLFGEHLSFGASIGPEGDKVQAQLIQQLARFVRLEALDASVIHYPEAGDAAAAELLYHPRQAPERMYQPPAHPHQLRAIPTEADVLERWKGPLEDLAHGTGEIARRCSWRPGKLRRVYPSMDLERGYDPNSFLFDMVIRGASRHYGEINEDLKQRINQEFEELKTRQLAGYLLLNYQIARILDEEGVTRGVGRGRLVSSLLAYCLGITRIDPVLYQLKPKAIWGEGEQIPDVLVEVPRAGVGTLLRRLREEYGPENLIAIGKPKMLRRDHLIQKLAEWCAMTDEEKRLARREKSRVRSTGAAQRLGELTSGHRQRRWRDPSFINDLAARLSPRPHNWHHAAERWALGNESLEAIVPRVIDDKSNVLSAIEDAAIERLGLARLTFVPHALLDTLDHAMRAAREQDPSLDFQTIPLDDPATFDLLARGKTLGIPPLESIALRCVLRRSPPRNLLQILRARSEALPSKPGEKSRELGEDLPDALLSYHCAWLKANHPQCFYAAAISAIIDHRGNLAVLLREARHAGFRVEPPDVNLSEWGTVIHGGSIRLGLAVVRGLGHSAWHHIQEVRSGGLFTSLQDFCDRIDAPSVNQKLVRALIASGAMDSFGESRARMDALTGQLMRRARGRIAPPEAPIDQGSLFDIDDLADPSESIAPEEISNVADWNDWERLRREAEALGFYLSIDPIARMKIAVDRLKPMFPPALGPRHIGRTVRLAGLVAGLIEDSPLLENPGDILLDVEGVAVLLRHQVAVHLRDFLETGAEVLVIGHYHRQRGFPLIDADGVWPLATLEDQSAMVGRVHLNLRGENKSTLKLLLDLVRQFPGRSPLALEGYEERRGFVYKRLARSTVFFCSPLYQGLRKILSPEAIELYDHDDCILNIQSAGNGHETVSGEDPALDQIELDIPDSNPDSTPGSEAIGNRESPVSGSN